MVNQTHVSYCLLVQGIQKATRMDHVILPGSNHELLERKGEIWVALKG